MPLTEWPNLGVAPFAALAMERVMKLETCRRYVRRKRWDVYHHFFASETMQYTILYIRHLNQKDKCPARLVFGAKSSFWWPNPTCVRCFFQIKLIGFSKVAGNAVLPSHFELPMWPVTPWRFVMDVISPRMMWQKQLFGMFSRNLK